ncbi:PD-(D/E)XK nuclease family protein [Desulfococcaceae bacterium HSG8]|nr:PD-(D/E)XK nuclease family protein [Desulfococcaceae bacterium HSG8]
MEPLRNKLDIFFSELKDYHGSVMKDLEDKLNNFFNDLSFRTELFKQTKRQADRYLSSDFNVFDLILPDENKLSDIIADILNIEGTHGQREIFVEIFVEFLRERGLALDNDNFEVKREYYCDGKIDILLLGKKFAIIIENKPFADDQEDQIQRYKDCISKLFGEKYVVIYLNKNKNNPTPYSIPEDELNALIKEKKFATVSYYEFSKFLKLCYQKCESQKFRYFLSDFIDYIENNFEKDEVNDNGNDE